MAELRARVQVVVQDPAVAGRKGFEPTENVDILGEDFFLDGPVTRRVAVLDFDPDTGALLPGAPFTPPNKGAMLGRYTPKAPGLQEPTAMQINVFGVVMQTVRMFEEKAGLGRPMHWAFDGPQLLVIPRAGNWPNAFYERESRSLQFFFFDEGGQRIYTCLSRDIIAHETGHAILDGIAPDLYDAITPQSLGLHEAVADIVALLMAFRSDKLVDTVLRQTNGSIEHSTAFNSIAEEFGGALHRTRKTGYLRDLLNDKTLADVSATEPHELSEVLSGALYSVMVELHGQRWDALEPPGGPRTVGASGKALAVSGELFKRLVLRALDYLPPGEISFADYGRALYASDRAAYPDIGEHRDRVAAELVKRKVAPTVGDLAEPAPEVGTALADAVVENLLASDFAAYKFASEHRELLRMPPDVPFRVLPRAHVVKEMSYGRGSCHELIFKVAWDHIEPNKVTGLPGKRRVTAGTTLVLDWDTGTVRAVLTTDLGSTQAKARDAMIRRLVDSELLELDQRAIGPDGLQLGSVVAGRAGDGVLRLGATARTLHLSPPEVS